MAKEVDSEDGREGQSRGEREDESRDVGGEREKKDDQVEVRNKTRKRVELGEPGSEERERGGELNTVQESRNGGRDQRHVEGVSESDPPPQKEVKNDPQIDQSSQGDLEGDPLPEGKLESAPSPQVKLESDPQSNAPPQGELENDPIPLLHESDP